MFETGSIIVIDRPPAGGHVALEDDDLARIGLAVVLEAAAKSSAASALRALSSLSYEEWVKLERVQFKQILERIESRITKLQDVEISLRFAELQAAIEQGHDARHLVVHVTWGVGGDGVLGYDYGREREATTTDILDAVNRCGEIKRAAHWFAMRVANLIVEGVLPEREDGRGMTICAGNRDVRL